VFGAEAIRSTLAENNVAVVVADLSSNDQRIWKELYEMNERGLPVNLVYPSKLGSTAIKLPTILSTSNVAEAIEEAAESK